MTTSDNVGAALTDARSWTEAEFKKNPPLTEGRV